MTMLEGHRDIPESREPQRCSQAIAHARAFWIFICLALAWSIMPPPAYNLDAGITTPSQAGFLSDGEPWAPPAAPSPVAIVAAGVAGPAPPAPATDPPRPSDQFRGHPCSDCHGPRGPPFLIV